MKSKPLGYGLIAIGVLFLLIEIKTFFELHFSTPTTGRAVAGASGYLLGMLTICGIGILMIWAGRKMLK